MTVHHGSKHPALVAAKLGLVASELAVRHSMGAPPQSIDAHACFACPQGDRQHAHHIASVFFPTDRDASAGRIPADKTDEITDLRALLEEQAKLNQALRKQLDQLERSNEDEAG